MISDYTKQLYTMGRCQYLAEALSRIGGWPTYGVEVKGLLVHWLVRVDPWPHSGPAQYLDVLGLQSNKQVLAYWGAEMIVPDTDGILAANPEAIVLAAQLLEDNDMLTDERVRAVNALLAERFDGHMEIAVDAIV